MAVRILASVQMAVAKGTKTKRPWAITGKLVSWSGLREYLFFIMFLLIFGRLAPPLSVPSSNLPACRLDSLISLLVSVA